MKTKMKRKMKTRRGPSARLVLETLAALVKVRLLGRKIPIFVEWNVTFRCNLRCRYCAAFEVDRPELGTEAICAGLDELWWLGTRWITFGGGEPLMRKDLSTILEHAKQRGFQVFLSTNGWFLPQRRAELEWIDHVNLSLDGGPEVHDAVRGDGAFDKTVEAIRVCNEEGVPASLQCVLSSLNLDAIDDVIAVASEHGVPVMFQPATQRLDSSTKRNPIAPAVDAYREAMARLIALKRQGAPIRNSLPGLRHLARWPDPTPIWCSAGIVTCSIEPDGTLVACHQAQVGAFLKGGEPTGTLTERYAAARIPQHCVQCWCAPVVELALLFSLEPGVIWNALRTFL